MLAYSVLASSHRDTPLHPGSSLLPAARCAQAVMVLVFMFAASWRLTVVTFVLVPCVLVISKVCGVDRQGVRKWSS